MALLADRLPRAVQAFKMLYVRSTDDLQTKARIRNAAVECFGRDGFDTGIRVIAKVAGVSPGLIVHHFGSKTGLREACDRYVLSSILEAKLDAVGSQGPEAMLLQLSKVEEYQPIAAYAVSSLAAGGDLAERLLSEMTEMTVAFLEAGVEAGTIRPSSDPEARARYLTLTGMGMLLLEYRRSLASRPDDLAAAFDAVAASSIAPALELFTHGLFTDARYLTAYTGTSTPDSSVPADFVNEGDDQ